jgi:pentatricopeptide repeat protein
MVFHKALPFTRLTLGKSLTHGPQSVVAASQSWNASHPLNNRFQKYHTPSHIALSALQSKSARDAHDAAFADYLRKWQRDQRLGANHWRQYQIYKPLEWPLRDPASESKPSEEQDLFSTVEPTGSKEAKVESVGLEILAKDEIAIEALEEQKLSQEQRKAPISGSQPEHAASAKESVVDLSPTSVSSFSEQLSNLASSKHYAEIPAVFEAMLNEGIKPSSTDYNALLSAAVHLPKAPHEAIAKALDVYADMLQRSVLPDIKTYTMIIERLSFNALAVDGMHTSLEAKRTRYGGMEEEGRFLFKSSESENTFLSQDESIIVAMRLFDTALSIYPQGPFSERTYRLLISACAAHKRIPEMVTVYSHMDSQGVTPSAEIFATMIPSFAIAGDMSNAVEMYHEYKQLAIRNNEGEMELVRKDNDIYAALVKAYTLSGDSESATDFMNKLEKSAADAESFKQIQDAIALKALVPVWLDNGAFTEALTFVKHKLTSFAREIGLAAVCIRAADRNNIELATEAFNSLSEKADIKEPAFAMSAMHIRNGNLDLAERFWNMLESSTATTESLELATMHALAFLSNGDAEAGFQRARSTYDNLRQAYNNQPDILAKIDESIEVLGSFIRSRSLSLSGTASVELFAIIAENSSSMPEVTAHVLASIGPEDIMRLDPKSLEQVAQTQASMIINGSQFDVGHLARFTLIIDTLLINGIEVSTETSSTFEAAFSKIQQPELLARWQSRQYPVQEHLYSPTQFSQYPVNPVQQTQPALEDSYDPYAQTTDNKGSVIITDLLEKPHGKFSNHLNEALVRFRNMRRAGRHPRFFTYAKLISAAAKDNRIQLAHEILALARQDVPYIAQYRIVRFGWVSILDSMVAACLQTGQRHLAEQFHQELRSLGAAPSANTFGLYITTLKESAKTFDEASEALKIFLQAKNEGVEPTSFLYNALIGKLGKARRIDDCLFYFQEMRRLGIRPTSVTYGTIVNALCRVSDEKFAEELFEEMENMPNYKPRPAPYHSMMQFFLSTKRDRSKVLAYYERMRNRNIPPTAHTFKLLIDSYATLEPVDMDAAGAVLDQISASGSQPDAVHYSSLIHAKGCVAHDMPAARALFDQVIRNSHVRPQPCLYQAMFEVMVANHAVADSEPLVQEMRKRGVELTPYIANALIHGWAVAEDLSKAEAIFRQVPQDKREPSTYEAMTRAYMMADARDKALGVVNEALARGYPTAVASKILDLVGTKSAWWTPTSSSMESSVEGGI